jgi:acetylornithine deacetylase/succinyl-diaminopimelate desuccinylase-like protein
MGCSDARRDILATTNMRLALAALAFCASALAAQVDWSQANQEALKHFQALVRMNTSDPPGDEAPAAEYLRSVLQAAGVPAQVFTLQPRRANLVARLKGSGAKRPILIMGHTDTVTADPSRWQEHGPFSADRAGGFIYGRGSTDDKDNVVASLMTLLLLKRLNVPLDRDVIFLAEAGEEGNTQVGIAYLVEKHWPEIDAEFCLAEGGEVSQRAGKAVAITVTTTEKVPARATLTARGTAGHGSIPRVDNAIARLARALVRVWEWQTPMRLNDTTRAYFTGLAAISPPELADRYKALLDPARSAAAEEYLRQNEPTHYSMLRTSISPTVLRAGDRMNVIPSEAQATLDIRAAPGEDLEAFFAEMGRRIGDDTVTIARARQGRPPTQPSRLDSEMYRTLEKIGGEIYPGTVTLPGMLTGATDMAYLRERGMQCYGIGPLHDIEEAEAGHGAHSDQERILEEELYRFVRFQYEVVAQVARKR